MLVPENTTDRDDGWRAFRVNGTLEFSLTGILARLSAVLAALRASGYKIDA